MLLGTLTDAVVTNSWHRMTTIQRDAWYIWTARGNPDHIYNLGDLFIRARITIANKVNYNV